MHEGPSIAAIVVPWSIEVARERVATALTSQGFVRRKAPLPAGYRPTPGEWVGLVALALPPHALRREQIPNTALVSVDVARIFHLALTLSAAHAAETLVAWRRFSGFEPCAKVLWGGRPRWKDGADHDHEVGFFVPNGAPADLQPPAEARVPLDRETLDALLLARVKPVRDPFAEGGEAWLHRSSPVA